MSRIATSSCRLCRREGEKLFLKGTRCSSDKCAVLRRAYPPGVHGQRRRRKPSNYALQLREKQKAKRIYGLIEGQFRNYFKKAERTKGITGNILLSFLEQRLDNVIFRACFAESRSRARQVVKHGFVKVNGQKVDIPSYLIKTGDLLEIVASDTQTKAFIDTTKILEDHRGVPEWMEVTSEKLSLKVLRLPEKKDLGMVIEDNLIVELYSK